MLSNSLYPCYQPEDVEEIAFPEYINALTFNKVVYKVAQNLIQFKNVLVGRFTGYYDIDNLMKYDGLLKSVETMQYFATVQAASDDNFFLHANEPNTILVNRTLECIWNVQNGILQRMDTILHTTTRTGLPKYTFL